MDYFNTSYIKQTDVGVGFHNLMNNLKPLTFRVKTFQLLLSIKSLPNVNSYKVDGDSFLTHKQLKYSKVSSQQLRYNTIEIFAFHAFLITHVNQ